MKKFFLFVLVIILGYLFYYYFSGKNVVEISDSIVITQASGLDINAGPSPPIKYAYVKGIIKNVGDKDLANIIINYTVGYDTISATIAFLKVGGASEFKTNNCRIRSANPAYSLEGVKYK
jgi:hypothetical protein